MRRISVFSLVAVLFVLISGQALALNSPAVSAEHGVITGMFVSDHGLVLSGEYGLNSQWAVMGSLGDPISRLGAKYEVSPTFALTGGVIYQSPFIGINGGMNINSKVQGMYEGAFFMNRGQINLFYEIGAKFNIDSKVDIRGGFIGFLSDRHFPNLQLGIGYRF